MFELQTFHDCWIIRNTENGRELKYLKSDYDSEFIYELMDFLEYATPPIIRTIYETTEPLED